MGLLLVAMRLGRERLGYRGSSGAWFHSCANKACRTPIGSEFVSGWAPGLVRHGAPYVADHRF